MTEILTLFTTLYLPWFVCHCARTANWELRFMYWRFTAGDFCPHSGLFFNWKTMSSDASASHRLFNSNVWHFPNMWPRDSFVEKFIPWFNAGSDFFTKTRDSWSYWLVWIHMPKKQVVVIHMQTPLWKLSVFVVARLVEGKAGLFFLLLVQHHPC